MVFREIVDGYMKVDDFIKWLLLLLLVRKTSMFSKRLLTCVSAEVHTHPSKDERTRICMLLCHERDCYICFVLNVFN